MSTITTNRERENLRAELNRRRMIREAEAIHGHQELERKLEREAEAELRSTGRITYANANERRMMREQSIARRRDALERSLSYPMGESELVAAVQHATLAAKVPADSFEDVSQAVVLHVIRRHGPNPIRARVGGDWLRRRAQGAYLNMREADERATGARAAAEELARWQDANHRAAMREAALSGDSVRALAEQRPVIERPRELAPGDIARRLGLAPASRAAQSLAAAIDPDRRRALTGAERVAWHGVRNTLRGRFHDAAGLLLAIRPARYAAEELAEAAIAAMRRRTEIASHGGHLAARRDSASLAPLARLARPRVAPRLPVPVVGPTTWHLYGDGYSGACAVPRGRRT